MSDDTRFDCKRIYKFMSATPHVYEIRGKCIHKANNATQPEYEIRGNYIHKAHSATQLEYEIRGDKIHKAHSGLDPVSRTRSERRGYRAEVVPLRARSRSSRYRRERVALFRTLGVRSCS